MSALTQKPPADSKPSPLTQNPLLRGKRKMGAPGRLNGRALAFTRGCGNTVDSKSSSITYLSEGPRSLTDIGHCYHVDLAHAGDFSEECNPDPFRLTPG